MLCVFWIVLHLATYWAIVAFVRYVYYPHTAMDRNCAKGSLINQALSFPSFLAYERWRPAPWARSTPCGQVPALYYLTDVYFYVFHRAFHTKALYAAFHRVHHEYDDPCPENALHAHPIEHLVVNFGAIVVPLLVAKASTLLATFWVVAVSVNVVASHAMKIPISCTTGTARATTAWHLTQWTDSLGHIEEQCSSLKCTNSINKKK